MTYPKTNNIENNNILNHSLSVQLSLSGLSFLVIDTISKKSIFFLEEHYSQLLSPDELLIELTSIIKNHTILQEEFASVTLIYSTTLYSLVPNSLFDEKMASEYLKLNSKLLKNDYVAYDTLTQNELTVVYIPFININNYIFERYGNFKYYQATTLLLKELLNFDKQSYHPKMYINIERNIFDLIIVNKESLTFCNTFEYKTSEDFIYYILFSLEQLKLHPDTIECILSGHINIQQDIYQYLHTYIRHISFIDIKKLLVLEEKEKHQHLTIKLSI